MEILKNKKLLIDDLKEGMWVWNATEDKYCIIRYIYKKNDTYRWVDEWGNIIENDELYKYKSEKG